MLGVRTAAPLVTVTHCVCPFLSVCYTLMKEIRNYILKKGWCPHVSPQCLEAQHSLAPAPQGFGRLRFPCELGSHWPITLETGVRVFLGCSRPPTSQAESQGLCGLRWKAGGDDGLCRNEGHCSASTRTPEHRCRVAAGKTSVRRLSGP